MAVRSRAVKRLEVAVHWHTVLVHMRRIIIVNSDAHASFEVRLRAAIARACADASVMEADISLSFSGTCPLYSHIGRSISTGFSVDLHGVMAQVTRLREAKQLGWLHVREAWI